MLEMTDLPARNRAALRRGQHRALAQRRADTSAERRMYWHFPHYSNHGMQSPGGAVRAGDYKLIEYFENHSTALQPANDTGEQHDLIQEEPETAARLKALLHEWRTKVSAQMMEPNPDYQAARSE